MDLRFIAIVEQLAREQGKAVFLDAPKCKSLLNDYAKNEYKKERHLLLLAIEIGAAKEIANATDLTITKKVQIRILKDDHFIDEAAAAGIIDLLGLVLCGNRSVSAGAQKRHKHLATTPPTPSYIPPPKQQIVQPTGGGNTTNTPQHDLGDVINATFKSLLAIAIAIVGGIIAGFAVGFVVVYLIGGSNPNDSQKAVAICIGIVAGIFTAFNLVIKLLPPAFKKWVKNW